MRRRIFLLLGLLLLLAACRPAWQCELNTPAGANLRIDRTYLRELAPFALDEKPNAPVPLERVLWQSGHQAIDTLELHDNDGETHSFAWADIAVDALWYPDGQIDIGGDLYSAQSLSVSAPPLADGVTLQITDIAPSVAAALGIPAPASATGSAAVDLPHAEHVLLLFLDGFGYLRYQEALQAGHIPVLGALPAPEVAYTVYPPVTCVSSAALLCGAPPTITGVLQRGLRSTDSETLFDQASAAGLSVKAVEGDALSFALRNATIQLSGDRDGNGSTDDNVLANTLALLEEGMPDLLWVHFHGIDDAGHSYGPGAAEEIAAVQGVDSAVGEILAAIPADTLVLIFADHGMHSLAEGGGNHGNLVERDIFIPIFVIRP